MRFLFLGTGTSTGVPQIGCKCPVCTSPDITLKRLRASAIVEVGQESLLIDCGPDLRQQLLRAGAPRLTATLVTHSHYDHVGGIDDLRFYCNDGPFPVYCTADVAADLRARVPYCFREHPYPGSPSIDLRIIGPDHPFRVGDVEVTPLPVMHYKLPIVGYRIGPLAYITDCKTMPESTIELLRGVDTLVLNALRIEPHFSHFSLDEALEVVAKVKPRRTYLTHMSHGMPPLQQLSLPPAVTLAHDFMQLEL